MSYVSHQYSSLFMVGSCSVARLEVYLCPHPFNSFAHRSNNILRTLAITSLQTASCMNIALDTECQEADKPEHQSCFLTVMLGNC